MTAAPPTSRAWPPAGPAPRPARRRSRVRVPLPLAIVALVTLCAALLGWRKDVVRHAPQLASFYSAIGLPVNLRGLTFADLKIGNEIHDGVPVLVVEGMIVSTVSKPVDVPRLRFALRSATGAEVYAWTAQPSQPVLGPFETMPFRSRLASPPAEGHDIQVRFFTRRDAVAGSAEAAVARILIAEDEEPLRTLVTRALAEDGHAVVATADGAEALETLQSENGEFDLLLADIKMPVMDGIALALAVARDFPELPILLMTGYADQRERVSGLEALILDVIAKPFTVAEIKSAVASAVAKGKRSP